MNDEVPKAPETHPAVKSWKGWYPGKMGVANERGYYPGCAFKMFNNPDEANAWFTENVGLLVVDVQLSQGFILVMYTKILDPEEKQESDDVMHEVREMLDKRRAEREAREEEAKARAEESSKKAAEEAEAAEKELKRLAELGRRHEKNCRKEK